MQNNQTLCIRILGSALTALLLLVANLPTSAERRENWVEVKSPHFTVYSNAGEQDGRRIAHSPNTGAGSAMEPAAESFRAAFADKILTSEGKITELICGRPPAVMFTLTTPTEQLLFQAQDINKLDLQDSPTGSNANLATCSAWKDRTAKVSYGVTSGGPAHGEVKAIAFE